MAGKEVVALDEEELAELERIVQDKDKAAALDFLRRTIWQRVRSARLRRLDPNQGTRVGL